MAELDAVLEWMRAIPWWASYGALFVGSYVEYIVPFIPGDTVIVAGAVLVAVFGWPVMPVFALVMAGTVAGAVTAWYAGRGLDASGRINTLSPRKRRAIGLVLARFERHGPWILALNRFFPGIRGFFFLGAGLVRVPLTQVILWATVGGAVWNALLLMLGWHLGRNLHALERVLTGNGIALGALMVVAIGIVGWKTWREMSEPDPIA